MKKAALTLASTKLKYALANTGQMYILFMYFFNEDLNPNESFIWKKQIEGPYLQVFMHLILFFIH